MAEVTITFKPPGIGNEKTIAVEGESLAEATKLAVEALPRGAVMLEIEGYRNPNPCN